MAQRRPDSQRRPTLPPLSGLFKEASVSVVPGAFRQSRMPPLLWSAALLLTCVALFYVIKEHRARQQEAAAEFHDNLKQEVARLSDSVNQDAAAVESATQELADALHSPGTEPSSDGDGASFPERKLVWAMLRTAVARSPAVLEAGVVFAPHAYDSSVRLFGVAYQHHATDAQKGSRPTCRFLKDSQHCVELDALRDYTAQSWYREAIALGQAGKAGQGAWSQPEPDPNSEQLIARYSVPITVAGRVPAIAYALYSTQALSRQIRELKHSAEGAAFAATPKGALVVAHSDRALLKQVLENTAASSCPSGAVGSPQRASIAAEPRLVHTLSGFTPIELCKRLQPGWDLVVQGVPTRRAETVRNELAGAGLLASLALALIGLPLCRIRRWTVRALSTYSIYFTLLVSGTLTYVLILSWDTPRWTEFRLAEDQHTSKEPLTRPLTSDHAVNEFKRSQIDKALSAGLTPPVFVPTGIFVQSVVFVSGSSVRVTGYAWQRYHDEEHEGVSRGILMPESEEVEIEQEYSLRDGKNEVIGWRFNAVLVQRFDRQRYPFGRENVWVQLWHKDFHKNVILVPELSHYERIKPETLPGVTSKLVLPGWQLESSFFNHVPQSYDADFGVGDLSALHDFPELHFNIIMKHGFWGPFVSHLLPVIVVSLLLYIILLLCTTRDELREKRGIETMNVIAACAGFFLVAIVSHVSLRETLAAERVIYLEYFYFVTYLLTLAVAINAMFVTNGFLRFIQYRDNLFAKVLFWPLTQLTLLAISLWVHYT